MSITFSRLMDGAARVSIIPLVVVLTALSMSSCSKSDYVPRNSVSRIDVHKSERRLELYRGSKLVRQYAIGLGSAPVGHKFKEGDGKTPVGRYVIDRRNPRSQFYLSLGISYPSERDRRVAALLGVDPGGDIFIHGQPSKMSKGSKGDWTAGCIAVSNANMYEIYRLVRVGTPIHIYK